MKFNLIDPVLWLTIQNQIDDDFGVGVTKKLLGKFVPISLESESGKSIYLCPMDWISIIEQGFGSFVPYSIGFILGEIVLGKFSLSISSLDQIKHLTDSQIVISERAAGSFTYGKSILKESALEFSEDLKKGQSVVVLNENHDCLGLATMTADGYRVGRMRPHDLVAKNEADIGFYIRKFY
jgi:ribosome biogenesis protein Nip4